MNKEMKSAAIVFLVFFVIAAVFGYQAYSMSEEKARLESEIGTLNASIGELKAKVARLPDLKKELDDIEENLANYIKILPSPEVATEERLLELVQEKRERAQLSPTSMITRGGKSTKGGKSGFREIDVTINAEATFEQFLRFLNALERNETFLRVNSFSCNVATQSEAEEAAEIYPLTIVLNLSTFRYEAGGK